MSDTYSSPADVIRRVCWLFERVNTSVFNFSIPTDCICGENTTASRWLEAGSWRFSSDALDFVERAVENEIVRRRAAE